MADSRKHFNPNTGKMEKCSATNGNCPFSAHFIDDKEGQAYADEYNKNEADRASFLDKKEKEYEKHHQNLLSNLDYDFEKNWENTIYKNLDDFTQKEEANSKLYEEQIRNAQTGEDNVVYIKEDVGYPDAVMVKTNLSEEEIKELVKLRENYVVGKLKEDLTKGIATPSHSNGFINDSINKENMEKEIKTTKQVLINDNLKNMRNLLNYVDFKKNNKFNYKEYTDGYNVNENAIMTINGLDYTLNNLGYSSSRLGKQEINISDGYENENYKVTFQKNGAMKVNFKKKDIPKTLNNYKEEYLKEADSKEEAQINQMSKQDKENFLKDSHNHINNLKYTYKNFDPKNHSNDELRKIDKQLQKEIENLDKLALKSSEVSKGEARDKYNYMENIAMDTRWYLVENQEKIKEKLYERQLADYKDAEGLSDYIGHAKFNDMNEIIDNAKIRQSEFTDDYVVSVEKNGKNMI
jgi:hypothetical protein